MSIFSDSKPDSDISFRDAAEGLLRQSADRYVVGVDIAEGPPALPTSPRGFLYAETGTAPGKWHLFMRVTDRLDGQVNLVGPSGQLVAELKGYGHALRSWPSVPPDKPRGYAPLAWATNIEVEAPLLPVRQTAEGISDWMSRSLGCTVSIKSRERVRGRPQRHNPILANELRVCSLSH